MSLDMYNDFLRERGTTLAGLPKFFFVSFFPKIVKREGHSSIQTMNRVELACPLTLKSNGR